MMTSSGQAAEMIAILNLCNSGDHLIASGAIYGGTTNLFSVTLKKLGIEVTYVDPYASDDTIQTAFRPTTRAVFGETIANPALTVFDIERFARVAHANGVPLIVDNTFPTAVLCRPFDFGADIVTYSTSKYLDGHAISLGGMIVDSGRFDWRASGKFPGLTEPDPPTTAPSIPMPSARRRYCQARVQLMRDLGATPSPMNAFLLNLGMETLHLRMERHCTQRRGGRRFLEGHPRSPGSTTPDCPLPRIPRSSKNTAARHLRRDLLRRQRRTGCRRALHGQPQARAIVVHVADARTGVLHRQHHPPPTHG